MNMTMTSTGKGSSLVPPLIVPPLKKGLLYDNLDPMVNINPNAMIPKILNKTRATAMVGMTMSSLGDYSIHSPDLPKMLTLPTMNDLKGLEVEGN